MATRINNCRRHGCHASFDRCGLLIIRSFVRCNVLFPEGPVQFPAPAQPRSFPHGGVSLLKHSLAPPSQPGRPAHAAGSWRKALHGGGGEFGPRPGRAPGITPGPLALGWQCALETAITGIIPISLARRALLMALREFHLIRLWLRILQFQHIELGS